MGWRVRELHGHVLVRHDEQPQGVHEVPRASTFIPSLSKTKPNAFASMRLLAFVLVGALVASAAALRTQQPDALGRRPSKFDGKTKALKEEQKEREAAKAEAAQSKEH